MKTRSELAKMVAEQFFSMKKHLAHSQEKAQDMVDNFWAGLSKDGAKSLSGKRPTWVEQLPEQLSQKEMAQTQVFVDILAQRIADSQLTDDQLNKYVSARTDPDFEAVMQIAEHENHRVRAFASTFFNA